MSVFAIIVSGRLVQTDFQQLDETKFLITIPEINTINHIVVFLTGIQPLPNGIGGAVYFSWPDPTSPPAWQYLGYISNEKPSAIFKISKLKPDNAASNPFSLVPGGGIAVPHVAQIGVSLEPHTQIQLLTPNSNATPSTVDSFMEFSNKMLENFVNFATSFSVTRAQLANPMTGGNLSESYIPVSTIQQWYTNFVRRFQQNPNFWKN